MADPTTAVLDNFNRGNGPPGSNWTAIFSTSEPVPNITSNQIDVLGTVSGSGYWNVNTFGPDTECYHTIGTLQVVSEYDAWVRMSGFHASAIPDIGYVLNSNGTNLSLYKADGAGGVTQIGSTTTGLTVLGLWLRAQGSNLKGYYWNGSAWVNVFNATDSTFSAAGHIGFEIASTSSNHATIDNFGGGALGQVITTDADIDASTWTTAPLWSKLNDSSDATAIGATAS